MATKTDTNSAFQPNEQTPQTDKDNQVKRSQAINLIRAKLDDIYNNEPDAIAEEKEVLATPVRSKHQQFMYELTTSGKDLVQIQTQWHNYYQSLSDAEKRQVWQEFYDSNQNAASMGVISTTEPAKKVVSVNTPQQLTQQANRRIASRTENLHKQLKSASKIKRSDVKPLAKITLKQHFQSLLFGLSLGVVAVIVVLFGFFNEVIIAPFIQPSRNDTATPIILSTESVAPSSTPEVIIPKINVEIPIDYSVNTTNENVIENDLEGGVIHYPTTSFPGQTGNAAFFGHSSNNIFNPGKYKFAFVLLHDLVDGDVFYLTYNSKIYAYKVFSTSIVSPNDVSVLNPIPGHIATATLITCDPPGTSINRLIVVGDQISPSPSGDTPATPLVTAGSVKQLPSNGPSLWDRYISTVWGKVITGLVAVGLIYLVWRWSTREPKWY